MDGSVDSWKRTGREAVNELALSTKAETPHLHRCFYCSQDGSTLTVYVLTERIL